jgi:hypothetical protein
MWFAFNSHSRYEIEMKLVRLAIALFAIAALGCGAAREVGHIVTAPARLVAGSDHPTPVPSDVEHPGRPVAATPTPRPKIAQKKSKSQKSPSPAASPRVAVKQPQFPVAKAVPGKPGVVYNPFDPKGGLIDVSGYAPGSKVKDPDSQKIFVVP